MAKSILLLEDSEDDELLFLRALKKAGMGNEVLVVRDGAEGIAYLKGENNFADREKFPLPDVIFLDLRMPMVDGFEVLQWIQSQPVSKKCLIVVLSHVGATKDINRAYTLGANSFLTKPVKEDDLKHLASHFSEYW